MVVAEASPGRAGLVEVVAVGVGVVDTTDVDTVVVTPEVEPENDATRTTVGASDPFPVAPRPSGVTTAASSSDTAGGSVPAAGSGTDSVTNSTRTVVGGALGGCVVVVCADGVVGEGSVAGGVVTGSDSDENGSNSNTASVVTVAGVHAVLVSGPPVNGGLVGGPPVNGGLVVGPPVKGGPPLVGGLPVIGGPLMVGGRGGQGKVVALVVVTVVKGDEDAVEGAGPPVVVIHVAAGGRVLGTLGSAVAATGAAAIDATTPANATRRIRPLETSVSLPTSPLPATASTLQRPGPCRQERRSRPPGVAFR